jgi:thiamine-phosphate pyrophosphorylase
MDDMQHNLAAALRLMLVTDDAAIAGRDLVSVCVAAERGGVTSVQLRLKHASAAELAEAARRLMAALRVPVLVNDRADVALAVGAAGVHVGPDDLDAGRVRRIAPTGFWIGCSVGSLEEVPGGAAADFWGVGPLHATRTKSDAGAALGIAGFGSIVAAAGGRPCIAIGSVRADDVAGVFAAGGAGVAVVSGILGAGDVEAAARGYASAAPPDG